MKNKFLAYPFLSEDNWLCDYEVLTDGLSSGIGHAYSFAPDKYKKDLIELTTITLDLNPMTRLWDEKIVDDAIAKLELIYDKYNNKFTTFFIPVGNSFATACSVTRMTMKQTIRLLNKHKFDKKLGSAFHIMTNIMHLIYLDSTDEKIIFTSKSYELAG